MTKQFLSVVIICCLSAACKDSKNEDKKPPKEPEPLRIEILDEAAEEVLDPEAEIKVLASGFSWTEGPLWIKEGNFLLFSDIPNNKVYKWDAENDTTTYLTPSGFTAESFQGGEPGSNGLLLNNEGELVLLQHGDRRVAKMKSPLTDPTPDYETVVDEYEGKRLNSPNDGVYDSVGNLYFSDPPYGLPKQMEDPGKELDFQGVYCLKTSGELILIDQLSRPNGLALSPDESVLYVAVSDPEHAVWYRYTIKEPGQASSRELLYDVTEWVGIKGHKGLPDGLKVHSSGLLFATGPGGVWVLNPQGKRLARIFTGQATANCAFGMDEKVLFMTADDFLMSVPLK